MDGVFPGIRSKKRKFSGKVGECELGVDSGLSVIEDPGVDRLAVVCQQIRPYPADGDRKGGRKEKPGLTAQEVFKASGVTSRDRT